MPNIGPPDLAARVPAFITRSLIAVFTVITLIGVFIPSDPRMPDSGLDPSWQYAMNEAIARHLSIGRDIIFTYGPYSSLSSRFYDPATDQLMMLGGLLLAISCASLLFYLARATRPWLLPAFLLYLAGFLVARDPLSVSRDALFYSFPLLVVVCVASFLERPRLPDDQWTSSLRMGAAALFTAPLGLLPLIKGTYLMLCGITLLAVVAQLLGSRRPRLAAIAFISPAAAMLFFWKLAGQAISDLPAYFTRLSPVVSGYTGAMSRSSAHRGEIHVFLAAAVVLLFSIATTRKISPPARASLAIYMTFFLFIAFKSSFVRQDVHVMIGGCSLVIASMILAMLFVDSGLIVALLFSFLAWFYIDKNHAETSTNVVFDNLRNVYHGMLDRPPFSHKRRHFLHHEFDHDLGDIRNDFPIPDLHGSVDIYPTEQSALLASNNTWNPRPLFQSYSAYTPALAAINERHLRGDNAPANILFSIDPIDMRLPSLDDGPSWPAFLDNYTLTRFDQENDFAYLSRNSSIESSSRFFVIEDGTHLTNQYVAIPKTNAPIFAQLDIEPTLLGKLRGIVYKYPDLAMDVRLRNGKTRSYRVVSGMMQSGFFLSPLVGNTKGFTSFMARDPGYFHRNAVDSIKIIPRSGNGTLWNDAYTLKLETWLAPDKLQ